MPIKTRVRTAALACICLLGTAGGAVAASTDTHPKTEWEQTADGETALVLMKSAPYPHASRDKGFVYNKKTIPREPHYTDNTVALFLPHAFHRAPKTNVLVYLHGWSNNVRKAISEFKIREQVAASKLNIVLIFPEGPRDATDSGCGKLEDKDGLKHLVEESLAVLQRSGKIDRATIGRVLIAGHSGAYRGLACCADHGGLDSELTGVCLLDSSYGNLPMFIGWVQNHPKGQLFSIFTDHLSAQNVYMFTHLQKIDGRATMAIDKDATDDLLAKSRTLFLHTETLKHDDTVQWLGRWLHARKLD